MKQNWNVIDYFYDYYKNIRQIDDPKIVTKDILYDAIKVISLNLSGLLINSTIECRKDNKPPTFKDNWIIVEKVRRDFFHHFGLDYRELEM